MRRGRLLIPGLPAAGAFNREMEAAGVPEVTREQWLEAKRLTDTCAPKDLPSGWREQVIPSGHPMHGARSYHHVGGMHVILSASKWDDGRDWLHVSVTQVGRCPFHAELSDVKRVFVGAERQALHVFPSASRHVNRHPYALHLWACLSPEGDGVPDFGKHGTI